MSKKKDRSLVLFWLIVLLTVIALGAWLTRASWPNWFRKIAPPEKLLEVYFLKEDVLAAVRRPISGAADSEMVLTTALQSLLNGPNRSERRRGFTSELPPQTVLRKIWLDQGVANLDFDATLENIGGGAGKIEAGLAQVVYTATAVPDVKSVRFWLNGRDGEIVIGSEGYVIDHALTRADFDLKTAPLTEGE